MKTYSPLQLHLLAQLRDGNFHNGNHLAAQLGVSRTAIWKNIQQFVRMGIPLRVEKKEGYQLGPFHPLQKESIETLLHQMAFPHPFSLFAFTEIHSTNQFLKELPPSATVTLCCAEKQEAGRGRFGRHWHSPFGENIYLSLRLQWQGCLSQLSGLSLVVSLAITESLRPIHPGIQVKWPNDLICLHKKLCGILVEILGENNGQTHVIIGIGLNVNMHTEQSLWCSLYEITGTLFDRNILIANLVLNVQKYLDIFLERQLAVFLPQWHQVDYLYGQLISVIQGEKEIEGIAQGINSLGQLLLATTDGEQVISSGEASIKKFAPG